MFLGIKFNALARIAVICLAPLATVACANMNDGANDPNANRNFNTPSSGLRPFPTVPLPPQSRVAPNARVLQCHNGFQRAFLGQREVPLPGWYTVGRNGNTVEQCPTPETASRMAFYNQLSIVTGICNYIYNGNPIGSSACRFGVPLRGRASPNNIWSRPHY